jgi:hypothetical protein
MVKQRQVSTLYVRLELPPWQAFFHSFHVMSQAVATAPAKKKKKGEVNAYGYNRNGLSRRARCAGLPRVHQLTENVATAILEANVRNALRVAATRAAIAKHHTVQLGYINDGIKLASGMTLLGHRTASKHWRSSSSSRKKKDKKAAAEATAAIVATK